MKLRDVAKIRVGYPFRGRIPEKASGNVHVVQMRDLNLEHSLGQIRWESVVKTEIEGRRQPDWLKSGDILFMARGPRNRAVCVKDIPNPAVCSQMFFQIQVKQPDRLIPEFLTWQINQISSQRYFEQSAEGTAQRSIRRSILELLPIAMPPLNRQKQIISFVEAAEKERELLNLLVANREQQLDAIARDLLDKEN